jgi:hypothetical protein
MELEDFTREALDGVEKNEGIIVLPKRSQVLKKVLDVLPNAIGELAARKIYESSLKDFPEIAGGRGPSA